MNLDDLTNEQIKELQEGRAVWVPYIPLQVTATFLGWTPSAVDRMAGLADPELQQRIEEYDALDALEALARKGRAFNHAGTRTGRLSSSGGSNPSNMPRTGAL